jgi:hypothetical protein
VLDGPGQLERAQSRDVPDERRAGFATLASRLDATTASGTSEESREELAQIAADFGAAIGAVMAEVRMDPDLRVMGEADGAAQPGSGSAPGPMPEEAFTEGTQALLDRLERLADMRDRGLLAPEEYETAKATIMAELEGRS